MNFGLEWRCCAKNDVFGPGRNLYHEPQQVVRLILLVAKPPSPSGLVGFVKDNGSVASAASQQGSPLF